MAKDDLTPKQQRFVDEYLIDLNGKQAAIRCGYSPKTAEVQASRLLSIAKVGAAVSERREKLAEKAEITQEMIVAELAKIGFANMLDYVSITSGGEPFIDLSALNREQAAAIAEMVVEDFKDGRGEDARNVRRIRFKLNDKQTALVNLGKHLGMFKDTVKLDVTGLADELEAARRRAAEASADA